MTSLSAAAVVAATAVCSIGSDRAKRRGLCRLTSDPANRRSRWIHNRTNKSGKIRSPPPSAIGARDVYAACSAWVTGVTGFGLFFIRCIPSGSNVLEEVPLHPKKVTTLNAYCVYCVHAWNKGSKLAVPSFIGERSMWQGVIAEKFDCNNHLTALFSFKDVCSTSPF